MKVLVVAFSYAPELGAAPSRLVNMAEGLLKHGAEVDVLTCLPNYPKGRIFDGYRGRFYKKDVINGINVYRYWTYPSVSKKPLPRILNMFAFATTLWAFAFRVKKIRSYSHVIIQTPPLVGAMSAMLLFKGLYRRKTILNISDIWPMTAVELGAMKEGSASFRFMAWIERYLYKHADAVQGQSNEILQHFKSFQADKKSFLYRNLQATKLAQYDAQNLSLKPFKIVYAGLCGVAQDILGIVKNIDFEKYNAEFHIFGGGNQVDEIKDYLKTVNRPIYYHGLLEKSAMVRELSNYHASIVPLVVRITGAVPSKIFDLLPLAIPVLFCGGGEGARIVMDYGIGYVSTPSDYASLEDNIKTMASLSCSEYDKLRQNCIEAAKSDFSYESQLGKYISFLETV